MSRILGRGVGFTGTYIQDYNDSIVCDIPESVAVQWVKEVAPNAFTGMDSTFYHMTDAKTQWLNKLFVVVGQENKTWICIYNKDFKFSVRTIPLEGIS